MAEQQKIGWQPEKPELIITDEGDIYAPLRRVQQQYYASANKCCDRIERGIYEDDADLSGVRAHIESLRQRGDQVGQLIPNRYEEQVNAEPNTATNADSKTELGRTEGESESESRRPISSTLGNSEDSTQQGL